MAVTEEKNIDMLEKLPDGNYKIKYPKTKASQVEGLSDAATTSISAIRGGVTKANVGLGSVQNYGIATKAEAQAGASNSKYMTPLRVKEAIKEIKPLGTGSFTIGSSPYTVVHNLGRIAIVNYWGSDLGGGYQNNYLSNSNTTSFTIKLTSSSGGDGSGVLYYSYW